MVEVINRIEYKNKTKNIDFEILDFREFLKKRPFKLLSREYRLDFWVILYITEGFGVHFIDFREYHYKKGDILFMQKNQVQRFMTNQDVDGYIIHINEPFFYRIKGFDGDIFLEFADRAFGSPLMPIDNGDETTNRKLIDLIYKEYSAEDLNIELIATLFQGFVLDLRKQYESNEKIFQSKDYENFKVFRGLVEAHYKTTRNVEEYANMMGLSKKTVNQATRKVAGMSAKQYIISRIVLEIKRLLSQGELMNYEIADELGFVEAANMTKFFKHYEGVSPKEFRALNLKRD